MLVCDLYLLDLVILVVSGLSGVLGTLGRILLSYLVHMHSCVRYLRQGQVHVGPITWEVLPQSLGRRVNVAACPSPDGSSARPSVKGGSEAVTP